MIHNHLTVPPQPKLYKVKEHSPILVDIQMVPKKRINITITLIFICDHILPTAHDAPVALPRLLQVQHLDRLYIAISDNDFRMLLGLQHAYVCTGS